MKRNLLLLIVTALLLAAATMFVDDGWMYAVIGMIATTIIAFVRTFNSKILKITRWAKTNPRKTQVLIGILQILIICIALLVGYDLKELGYKLNEASTIVFGLIMVVAFFSIRFLPKQNIVAIPAVVNKDRVAYMSIVLSAFVILVITGNRIEDKFPNSPISIALRSVDQSIFGDENLNEENIGFEFNHDQTILVNEKSSMLAFASITGVDEKSVNPEIHPKKEAKEKIKAEKKAQKLEKKKQKLMKRIEKLRKLVGAGATVLTVLLVILLVVTTCAGICLIAIGGSAGAVILGVVLLAGSIFGFVKIFQKKKKDKEA
jgi:hypothetical protein